MSDFLRITDKYKTNMNQKHGSATPRWENVIITSNQDPKTWYGGEENPQVMRRMTHIKYFSQRYQGTSTSLTSSTQPPASAEEESLEAAAAAAVDQMTEQLEQAGLPSIHTAFGTRAGSQVTRTVTGFEARRFGVPNGARITIERVGGDVFM